jgi:hypothetical protein
MHTRKYLKPILVTGSHRSGSTWTGKILSTAPHVGYIHEPFNFEINTSVSSLPMKYWFQHISEENSENYSSVFDAIIRYKYPLLKNIVNIRTIKNVLAIMRDQGLFILHKMKKDRPLLKDPIAINSVEWLYENFNMNILILIRHPAAFCSSIKIKNWKFDFAHFLNQPLLMEKYLYPFEEKIRHYVENEKSIIEQAILLWNCIHHTISIYRENHPDWLFVRHEDLSFDPVNQFRSIFKEFDLEFTQKVKKRILATSGAHNPVEPKGRNLFIRNSKENIRIWMKRLTHEEISLIEKKTSEVASLFYIQDEWW